MAEQIFGDIPGVNVGDTFKDREALVDAKIHRVRIAGIDGNPSEGASSIVLNGGYVDDYDLDNEILYTGHGGNDPSTKRQVEDQDWDARGNKALIVSELNGLPVRVTRGHKHKSKFSPASGYQYAGLYYVTNHSEKIGKDGFKICQYKLEKDPKEIQARLTNKDELPEGQNKVERTEITTLRIIRDSQLSKTLKKLYDYTCQVCSTRIAVRDVGYAEGAHIKPLGRPHNGHDKPNNLLCLCPNHHVMLDKGSFTIAEDMSLIGLEGSLYIHQNHSLNLENIEYHREHIYIND